MTIRIALLGAGRIGRVHAAGIGRTDGARLVAVHDPVEAASAAVAAACGARSASEEEIHAAPDVDAIVVATPTDRHAPCIEAATLAGKAVFCEKPIDLDVDRARACVHVALEAGTPLMVGFNRRFDPEFAEVRRQIDSGAIGAVEIVQITSRDPTPPPVDYLTGSGGLYFDMMIHDFDMARFLLREEVAEVFATGSALVDGRIGAAGDVDTAMATLTTASGRIAVITNSRRATYGYDQRIEVHGSKGMVSAGNRRATTVTVAGAEGYRREPLLECFTERYRDAYRREMEAFVRTLASGGRMTPDGTDGLKALEIAAAAARSDREHRVVPLSS